MVGLPTSVKLCLHFCLSGPYVKSGGNCAEVGRSFQFEFWKHVADSSLNRPICLKGYNFPDQRFCYTYQPNLCYRLGEPFFVLVSYSSPYTNVQVGPVYWVWLFMRVPGPGCSKPDQLYPELSRNLSTNLFLHMRRIYLHLDERSWFVFAYWNSCRLMGGSEFGQNKPDRAYPRIKPKPSYQFLSHYQTDSPPKCLHCDTYTWTKGPGSFSYWNSCRLMAQNSGKRILIGLWTTGPRRIAMVFQRCLSKPVLTQV